MSSCNLGTPEKERKNISSRTQRRVFKKFRVVDPDPDLYSDLDWTAFNEVPGSKKYIIFSAVFFLLLFLVIKTLDPYSVKNMSLVWKI